MTAKTYLPSREADLRTWAKNFSDHVEEGPATYGVTVEQSSAMVNANDEFDDAYLKANDPTTRSPTSIQQKNTRKKELIVEIRKLVAIIQAFPGTTDTMRRALGITVRDVDPTPEPVPATAPSIDVTAVDGYTIKIRLHGTESPRRGKPAGVQGAAVFSAVGDSAPTALSDWTFQGNTTRTDVTVQMPGSMAPGTKVWLTAFWYNRKAQSGPATTPTSTYVGYGGLSQAA